MIIKNRREFLNLALRGGVGTLAGSSALGFANDSFSSAIDAWLGSASGQDKFIGGEHVGNLPLYAGNEILNEKYGTGLGGRFRYDHSNLSEDSLITPNELFYVRTACPEKIDYSKPWKIRIHGLVEEPAELFIDDLRAEARPMGVHLLECSGNGGAFALLSAAHWDGVPVLSVLERVRALPSATRVLISGFDEHDQEQSGSTAGASWVMSLEDLEKQGAFFATKMNGVDLPLDHGFPVRLVMPQWYGCSNIKWVNEIRFVDDDEPATSQMWEFAGRTHQPGRPELARDYIPPFMDQAAMPVRVEHWKKGGETLYRVIGVMWGGDKLTDRLEVRFDRDDETESVENYDHKTNNTWTLWTHTWRPTRRGRHRISLEVNDPTIRTRRLDRRYYERQVQVRDVSKGSGA